MADLISEKYPNTTIYASKRWHLSNLDNVRHLHDKIQYIDCDLTDPVSTGDLISQSKPDIVFHFAAESFVSPSWRNPHRYMNVNHGGTINLLESIRKYSPGSTIHIPGSGEEYGDISPSELPINTQTCINPVNPYAVSKVAQDLAAKVYFDSYGTTVIRTRAFNHEGPRRQFVFGLPWYAYQICRIKQGLQEPRLETGHRLDKRNFTHVKDMCNAYLLATQCCDAGELYLVGNNDPSYEITFDAALTSMIEMAGLRRDDLEVVENPLYVRPTQVPFLIADNSRFVTKTNWKPELKLSDIFYDTIKYWEKHPYLSSPPTVVSGVHPL